MNKPVELPEQERQVWQEAADWLLRLQENPDCPELSATHQMWLSQSPEHAKAFKQTAALWQLSAALQPNTSPNYAVAGKPARKFKPLAIAACLLLLGLPWLTSRPDFHTSTGQHEQITLSDGSQLSIASQTRLDQDFNAQQRQLTLHQGRLFIDVAHEPQRPFVIQAGVNEIQVLGTAFEVIHSPKETRISVERGHVQVRTSADTSPIDLHAQQHLHLPSGETVAREQSSNSYIAAWRQWQLLVDDQPLSLVIEQLKPYYSGWILLADSELAQRRLTASVNLQNPIQALDTLLEPLGAQATQVGPVLWISAAKIDP